MAKRLSNRERVQRSAVEAELTAKEKSEKKTTKGKVKKKAKAKGAKSTSNGRIKLVWKIFDERLREVGVFPYPQKAEAEEKAARLAKKSGKEYRVRGVKIPLDEVI